MSKENNELEDGIKELEKKFDTEYAIYFKYNVKNIVEDIKRKASYMEKEQADKYIKKMSELVMIQYDINKAEDKVDEYSSKIVEARGKKRLNKKLIEKYKFEQAIFDDYASIHVKLLRRFNVIMSGGGFTDQNDQAEIYFDVDDEDPFM